MKAISQFKKCPLCKSKSKTKPIPSYSNRYSEDIARDLNISEYELLHLLSNVECKNCGLVYKLNWFKKSYLTKIFNKLIPTHPKGWDVNSKKFSKDFFLNSVKNFNQTVNSKSQKFNRHKRELNSLVSSIEVTNEKDNNLIKLYIEKIKGNKSDYVFKNKRRISKLIKKPKPFSRYSGYKSENLFKFIETKIGKIKNYSEIGCPKWGMLNMALHKKIQVSFFKPEKCYFWGHNCKNQKGTNCLKKTSKKIMVNRLSKGVFKSDFMGCFFILDHVFSPVTFIKEIFKKTNSVGIFLEKIKKENSIYSKGVAVQHFSGWNNKSINFLAKKVNRNVDTTFFDRNLKTESFYLVY